MHFRRIGSGHRFRLGFRLRCICGDMPFVYTDNLEVIEKGIGGWRGRQFHSPSMTFCHWEFDKGASVHEHAHAHEEVWEILAGKLEVTIDGVTQIAVPGVVAIVPPNVVHSVKALSAGIAGRSATRKYRG